MGAKQLPCDCAVYASCTAPILGWLRKPGRNSGVVLLWQHTASLCRKLKASKNQKENSGQHLHRKKKELASANLMLLLSLSLCCFLNFINIWISPIAAEDVFIVGTLHPSADKTLPKTLNFQCNNFVDKGMCPSVADSRNHKCNTVQISLPSPPSPPWRLFGKKEAHRSIPLL